MIRLEWNCFQNGIFKFGETKSLNYHLADGLSGKVSFERKN